MFETPVATFTDTDLNRSAADYTASIDWGDGTSGLGTVQGSAGADTVVGDHAYEHPGTFVVTASISDPEGGQTISSTSASVDAAPLTASGGIVEDAVPGTTGTWNLATFNDANPDDPAASYTATIDWGDGSPATSGVVTGSDGQFSVSGGHAYASAGTQTVTVTVVDTDGTLASTTSSVVVGDLFAGEQAQLTVASFASADPTATASSFTATINWGDGTGTTVGTVIGSGGMFDIQGSHVYAKEGIYSMQVTVVDQARDSLSADSSVDVVRAPLTLSPARIEATVGTALENSVVAVFTDPNVSNPTAEYSAIIDWGDGTREAGTVTGSGGLFEVVGTHTYDNAGESPVQVEVYWSDPVLVASTVTFAAVGFRPDEKPAIVGPVVVPNYSQYRYTVAIPPTDEKSIEKDWKFVVTFQEAFAKVVDQGVLKKDGKVTGFYADVKFPQRGSVFPVLELQNYLKGQKPISLEFKVVEVTVEKPTLKLDSRTRDFQDDLSQLIDGGNRLNVTVPIDKEEVDGVPVKVVQTASRLIPGIQWDAAVSLLYTVPEETQHITVGFVQHVTIEKSLRVFYAGTKTTLVNGTVQQGQTYLDVQGDKAGPLYSNAKGETLTGAWVDKATGTTYYGGRLNVSSSDSPLFQVPLKYDGHEASKVEYVLRFQLDVVASTDETANGANKLWLRQAGAVWTLNGSMNLGPAKDGYPIVPLKVKGQVLTGIAPPASGLWDTTLPILSEDLKGPTFNQAVNPVKYLSQSVIGG